MYEDSEAPVLRRVLWIVLWFIVIVAVAWVAVWLAFFRHVNTNTGSITPPKHSQQSQSKGKEPSNGNNTTGATAPKSSTTGGTGSASTPTISPSSGSTSTASNPAPSSSNTLANTGAGNIFIPFGAASVVGTALYYLRLRKKVMR
jgi:LPXTG-motif cell wall-anchored protein